MLPLEVGLIGPSIRSGVKQNIVELRFVHIIAFVQPRETF